ncbi:MAG: radical SAM protein [Eubacteriales bacterium]
MTFISTNNELPPSLAALLLKLDQEGIRDYRRYQMIRNYLNFRAREQGVPISGSFELTPLCNLDCKMCYVHLNKQQMQGVDLLPVHTWKNLMQQAVDAGMMYAGLTGGECLTYPGFKELYLFLRERGIETVILSNGVLMDREMVEFLRENPPASIQITFYGAGEDTYERVTGHRVFSKVMKNTLMLREANLPLKVGVTPNAYMDDGEELVRLLHSLGLPIRINSGLMAPRKETGRLKQNPELDQYIRMVKLQMSLEGKSALDTCDEELLPEPGGSGHAECGVQCGAGRSSFCISWDGLLRPCNTFPVISENLMNMSFSDGWKRINEQVKLFPLPAECAGCRYSPRCKHCVAEHASDVAIGHASPAVCNWIRQMVSEGIVKL